MAMKRRSLDELLLWNGVIALLVLFVPTGTVLLYRTAHSAERSLEERGASLGHALSGQIVEPMLVNDRLGLHSTLHQMVASEEDVRYLAIENELECFWIVGRGATPVAVDLGVERHHVGKA